MKNSWLRLMLILVALFGAKLNAPLQAQTRVGKAARLPASIRALMPRGAKSLRLFRLAPAPKAPQFIVHLWTTPRRPSMKQIEDGSKVDVPINSPFVMDVFTNDKTPSYRASLIFTSNRAPTKVKLWYLNARTKEGLVFQLTDDRDFDASEGHGDYSDTFFVFPLLEGTPQTIQTFQSSGGSSSSDVYHAAYDAKGQFELIHFSWGIGNPAETRELLRWEEWEDRFMVIEYVPYPPIGRWVWNREDRQYVLIKKKAAPK